MAGLPPHHEDNFPGNAFPAGAPWGAVAPPAPQCRAAPPNHPGINLGHDHPQPPAVVSDTDLRGFRLRQ